MIREPLCLTADYQRDMRAFYDFYLTIQGPRKTWLKTTRRRAKFRLPAKSFAFLKVLLRFLLRIRVYLSQSYHSDLGVGENFCERDEIRKTGSSITTAFSSWR